jgi:hypothetical protein
MRSEWIVRWRIPIIFMIAALTYLIIVGAFFIYIWREDQNTLLRQRTIAECLSSGGHIGPGSSCRHESPTDNTGRALLPP